MSTSVWKSNDKLSLCQLPCNMKLQMPRCRSTQPAPVQDMVNLEIGGRQLLLSVHGSGSLYAWDLLGQKRVYAESLLAEGLLDSTIPVKIASAPCDAGGAQPGLSSSSLAVNVLVVFGPRAESATSDSNYQVSHFEYPYWGKLILSSARFQFSETSTVSVRLQALCMFCVPKQACPWRYIKL